MACRCRNPTPWAMRHLCGSPPRGRCVIFVGAHPVGDGRGTRPANHRPQGGGSYKKSFPYMRFSCRSVALAPTCSTRRKATDGIPVNKIQISAGRITNSIANSPSLDSGPMLRLASTSQFSGVERVSWPSQAACALNAAAINSISARGMRAW